MSELLRSLLDRLEEQIGDLFALPVPLNEVNEVSIRTTPSDEFYLRLTFLDNATRQVSAIFQSVGEAEDRFTDPLVSHAFMRVWLPSLFYLRSILGDEAPDAILYRGLTGTPSTTDVTQTGTRLGEATQELEIAFLREETSGAWRFLDPAIVARMMASFDDDWRELVNTAISQRPEGSESFGLDRAINYFNVLPLKTLRWRMFRESLRHEYDMRRSRAIPTPIAIDGVYRLIIPPPSGASITRHEFLRDFATAVQGDPRGIAHYYLTDQDLQCVVFEAASFEMELINTYDFGLGFLELEPLLGEYQIIVNGPTFDIETCGKPPSPERTWRYAKAHVFDVMGVDYRGLTKGRLVFRSRGTVNGDCPITNPESFRFHFGQRLTGEYELATNLIPEPHDFVCAFDNVTGVFLQGQRIGLGREVETDRAEPDEPYGNPEKHPIIDGLPILGTCAKDGTKYFFIIMRPDYDWGTSELPEMSDWEEMIQLLRDMDVIDAFITDGDDSIGMMIEGDGIVIEPGHKKNGLIATAIGFRKID